MYAVQRFEYIIKRSFFAIIVLINISIITFFISRVLPSDPAAAWVGSHPTQEQIAKAKEGIKIDRTPEKRIEDFEETIERVRRRY